MGSKEAAVQRDTGPSHLKNKEKNLITLREQKML